MKMSIMLDEEPLNPRKEWDNLGTMACWHRNYNLGDEMPDVTPEEYRDDLPDEAVVVNLYLLDHRGITISTSQFASKWDSGWVGYIWADPSETSLDKEAIREVLEGEIETYDLYLRGEVWGVVVSETCPTCEQATEEVGHCFNFFGEELEETGIPGFIDGVAPEITQEEMEEAWENRSY